MKHLTIIMMFVLCTLSAMAQDPYVEDFSTTTGSELGLKSLPEGWSVIGTLGAFERRSEQGFYKNGKPGIAINGNSSNYLVTPVLEEGPLYFYMRQYTKNYAATAKFFYCNEDHVDGTLTVGDQVGDEAYIAKGTPTWTRFSVMLDRPSRVAILFSGVIDDFLALNGLYVGTPTAISNTTETTKNEAFTIAGQRLNNATNYKGIVIVDGKKMIRK